MWTGTGQYQTLQPSFSPLGHSSVLGKSVEMRSFRTVTSFLALTASLRVRVGRCSSGGILPQFPKQFSTGLEITSHLVDQNKEYPPWKRDMAIAYDHAGGRAKVVVKEGINAGKTFLRLYGSKKEYMVREGDYPSCRRSYLGDTMPLPELPTTASFQDTSMVEGLLCEHWLQDDGTSRIHIYVDSKKQVPRRLTEEAVGAGGAITPLVTYDFRDFKVGPQAPELFDLPEQYAPRETCDLHVGGFPYIHLFHHYLRV